VSRVVSRKVGDSSSQNFLFQNKESRPTTNTRGNCAVAWNIPAVVDSDLGTSGEEAG
jgi:hypothetical protein